MRAMLALAPVAAFLVALLAARLLLTPAGRRGALDTPNERSLHARPVPRTCSAKARFSRTDMCVKIA